jgi:hypothetical protein
MSISCHSCKQKISEADKNQAFVFSLGELINGVFLERETYHYHLECLNNHKSYKRKKKAGLQV